MKGIFMHQAISIHACFTTENHQLPLLGWIFARTRLRSKRRLLLLWEEEEFHQASRFSGGQTGPDQEGNQRTNTASLIWCSNWKKAKTHTHNALFLRWQTETERETEDLTLLDINWTPASFSPFKLLWPIRSHWWRLCSACVLLSSEAVSDPVRNDLHCWRLFRLSLKTNFFFFFYWCWPLWG